MNLHNNEAGRKVCIIVKFIIKEKLQGFTWNMLHLAKRCVGKACKPVN